MHLQFRSLQRLSELANVANIKINVTFSSIWSQQKSYARLITKQQRLEYYNLEVLRYIEYLPFDLNKTIIPGWSEAHNATVLEYYNSEELRDIWIFVDKQRL